MESISSTLAAEGPIGCQGGPSATPVPFLISWNITKRCNLRCAHCYLDACELDGCDETSTAEAERFIGEIASLSPHAMLILTGGEPLLRQDWPQLSRYASGLGLTVVIGTNGTLLDDSMVEEMIKSGVKGAGISLDSATPPYHDRFRGVSGAWEKTMAGIDTLKRHGLDFQIQFSVTRENLPDLSAIIDLAHKKGARAINIFFLVCTGRGQGMTDLSPREYEDTLKYLVKAEKEHAGIMVRARCAPHFLRVANTLNSESPVLKGGTSGCIAGTGYLRISPDGHVTPCPYMPASAGQASLKTCGLKDIWQENAIFRSLRRPGYNGRCKDCEFNDICGGCRARALARTGDLMGEDPWCEYKPEGRANKSEACEGKAMAEWTESAKERLRKVPFFLRGMVKTGVERYANSKGLKEITPELMIEMRQKTGR